jgi:hypothetical protein
MTPSRFVVGIDLGTTNCAVSYVDTGAGESAKPVVMPIPQVVAAGAVEAKPLLPSFLYLPGSGEQPAGALKLPWGDRDFCVGEFARSFGSLVPTRLVSSAKSWLCHPGVDRKAPLLPFRATDENRKVSPFDACTRYLKHLCEAWNTTVGKDLPGQTLEQQDVILTVPASFDAAARELTVEAAKAAGIEHLTLLEEPQAAFYAWLDGQGDAWRDQVQPGDLVLVADVGGGTSDFTLIEIGSDGGNLALSRLAVGEHLLLGGDNMDLALAHTIAQALSQAGTRLDAGQMLQLTHASRVAKEKLFADPSLASAPVTVLGKGRSVVGGTIKYDLKRSDVETVLVKGFFPDCDRESEPLAARTGGVQELGLPYASDAGITRHLAAFLNKQAESLSARERPGRKKKGDGTLPTAVLFNGGVFRAGPLREKLLEVMNKWAKSAKADPVRAIDGADLDLAVARGAATFGMVRRGKGIRIRGGTARAYYIGVETNMPAVPGMMPPVKALCVAPFGMEEGTAAEIPGYEVGLRVGREAEFRFLSSTVRRDDKSGTVVEDYEGQIDEIAPIRVTLDGAASNDPVPVHLHSSINEVGLMELFFVSRDGKRKWKIEFNVRG